jgi:ribose transport system substrate-binding protein
MRGLRKYAMNGRSGRPLFAVATGLIALVAVSAAAAATVWPSASREIARAGISSATAFCGHKSITLAVEDGYGINAWSQASYAAVKSTAAECKDVKVVTFAGGGVESTAIQQINSAVALGANAMTVIPDFGAAENPATAAAEQAGVKVVDWAVNPSGVKGQDYYDYIDFNNTYAATRWAQWMVKALHGKGNVIFLGGPAGNPYAEDQVAQIDKVFAAHPAMHLLTGAASYAVTNWDPATAQTVTASLLSQFPVINGVITNYGTDALAADQAFLKAGRKLVPIVGLDANGLSCLAKKYNEPLYTVSSRNWLGRIAARVAIAAAEGVPNGEPTNPSLYKLPAWEDTLAGLTYKCNASLPADFYSSDKLTAAQLLKYGTN